MSTEFRVVAIIAAYNEGDIIESILAHLVENEVDVYLIDNRSTDDTVQRASQWLGRGLIGLESFPAVKAGATFAWREILDRKMSVVSSVGATWYIHHDADEVRESPWPGLTLREAINWVDRLGYNAIDFRLLNFLPVDDGFRSGTDPKTYFTRYEDGAEHDRVQIKCWKAVPTRVTLADGGHEASFDDRRVCPIPFILRHYPVRSQEHGARKVLRERKDRFSESERALGWHVQYEKVDSEHYSFIRNPASLRAFDLNQVRLAVQLGGTELPATPTDPAPTRSIASLEGFLDHAAADTIAGWAWNSSGDEAVDVDLWAGSRLLVTVRADGYRADLRDAGKGEGRHGFSLRTPPELLNGRPHWIWANFAGTDRSLANSPLVLPPTRGEIPKK
jgi:glycosyltransferase involved in cell wall biosynthesis